MEIVLIRKKILQTVRTQLMQIMPQSVFEYEQMDEIKKMIPQECRRCIIISPQQISKNDIINIQKQEQNGEQDERVELQINTISIGIQLVQIQSGWEQILGQTVVKIISANETSQYSFKKWNANIVKSLIKSAIMNFRIYFKLMNNSIKQIIEKMMNDLEEYTEKEKHTVANIFNEFTQYPFIREVVYENFYSPSELHSLFKKDNKSHVFIILIDQVDIQSYLSVIESSQDSAQTVRVYGCAKRNNCKMTKLKYGNRVKWIQL